MLDVMYQTDTTIEIQEVETVEVFDWENDRDLYDGEETCQEFLESLEYMPNTLVYEFSDSYAFNIKGLVDKIRRVVRKFRKSTTKNEVILQKRVLETEGKNLVVILDCPTRWNSTLQMIERFVRLRTSISLALIDDGGHVSFNSGEWHLMESIVKSLQAIEQACNLLCKANTNLIKADLILSNALRNIPIDTQFGAAIYEALIKRINQRRQVSSIALFYLHFSNTKAEKLDASLKTVEDLRGETVKDRDGVNVEGLSGEAALVQFLTKIYTRSHPEEENREVDGAMGLADEDFDVESVFNDVPAIRNEKCDTVPDAIKRELTVFKATRARGKILEFCYNSLCSVQCTSAEAERNFSCAARIVNKFSTRLMDESINNLSMLNAYFKRL